MSLSRKLKRANDKYDKMSKWGTSIFINTVNNMMMIGTCRCGQPIYHYIKSERNNIFNAYCSNPDCPVQDVRFPINGTKFLTTEELKTPMDIVFFIQKEHNKTEYSKEDIDTIPSILGVENGR